MIVEQAKKSGIKRIIMQSVPCYSASSNMVLPSLNTRLSQCDFMHQQFKQAEQLLVQSGLPYYIIR